MPVGIGKETGPRSKRCLHKASGSKEAESLCLHPFTGQWITSLPAGWRGASSCHSAGASVIQLRSPHSASQNQETDGGMGLRLKSHTPPGSVLCTEKQRQSGEFPNQVYFEESSLQFQKACVPDHWFSGFPEQGVGDEQGEGGSTYLRSPLLTLGARGRAGCAQGSAAPASGVCMTWLVVQMSF